MANITTSSSTFFFFSSSPAAFPRDELNVDSISLRVSGIYHLMVCGEARCFLLDIVTHVGSLWRRGHEERLLIFSLPPRESVNVRVLTEGRLTVYQPLFIPPSYLCPGASVSTRLFLHLSPTITACIHLFIYSCSLAPLLFSSWSTYPVIFLLLYP